MWSLLCLTSFVQHHVSKVHRAVARVSASFLLLAK